MPFFSSYFSRQYLRNKVLWLWRYSCVINEPKAIFIYENVYTGIWFRYRNLGIHHFWTISWELSRTYCPISELWRWGNQPKECKDSSNDLFLIEPFKTTSRLDVQLDCKTRSKLFDDIITWEWLGQRSKLVGYSNDEKEPSMALGKAGKVKSYWDGNHWILGRKNERAEYLYFAGFDNLGKSL